MRLKYVRALDGVGRLRSDRSIRASLLCGNGGVNECERCLKHRKILIPYVMSGRVVGKDTKEITMEDESIQEVGKGCSQEAVTVNQLPIQIDRRSRLFQNEHSIASCTNHLQQKKKEAWSEYEDNTGD